MDKITNAIHRYGITSDISQPKKKKKRAPANDLIGLTLSMFQCVNEAKGYNDPNNDIDYSDAEEELRNLERTDWEYEYVEMPEPPSYEDWCDQFMYEYKRVRGCQNKIKKIRRRPLLRKILDLALRYIHIPSAVNNMYPLVCVATHNKRNHKLYGHGPNGYKTEGTMIANVRNVEQKAQQMGLLKLVHKHKVSTLNRRKARPAKYAFNKVIAHYLIRFCKENGIEPPELPEDNNKVPVQLTEEDLKNQDKYRIKPRANLAYTSREAVEQCLNNTYPMAVDLNNDINERNKRVPDLFKEQADWNIEFNKNDRVKKIACRLYCDFCSMPKKDRLTVAQIEAAAAKYKDLSDEELDAELAKINFSQDYKAFISDENGSIFRKSWALTYHETFPDELDIYAAIHGKPFESKEERDAFKALALRLYFNTLPQLKAKVKCCLLNKNARALYCKVNSLDNNKVFTKDNIEDSPEYKMAAEVLTFYWNRMRDLMVCINSEIFLHEGCIENIGRNYAERDLKVPVHICFDEFVSTHKEIEQSGHKYINQATLDYINKYQEPLIKLGLPSHEQALENRKRRDEKEKSNSNLLNLEILNLRLKLYEKENQIQEKQSNHLLWKRAPELDLEDRTELIPKLPEEREKEILEYSRKALGID